MRIISLFIPLFDDAVELLDERSFVFFLYDADSVCG